MPFYGLYIPPKGTNSVLNQNGLGGDSTNTNYNSTNSAFVFREKFKALEVLKLHKEARLREFSSENEALEYAQSGYEVVQTRYNDVKTSTAAIEKAAFRAPTKQELTEFRKYIEAGDYDRVKSIIWDNPRYLVSSGDTPTSLKEGCRYNAMHICALSKKPRIAELILQTVSNVEFADLLLGKKNDIKSSKELAANLLDYYLNMPEKGRSETPLHLASKIGCVEMIELLTSYPECKTAPNKEGSFPKDIICSRTTGCTSEVFQKIRTLLEERFYVPVLRSMDGTTPPRVGQPFSSTDPPELNSDPLSPEVKIQALAGPMNKEQAQKFCRRWKTPPRPGTSSSSPIANSPYISPMKKRLSDSKVFSPPLNKSKGYGSFSFARRRALFDSSPRSKSFNGDSSDTIDSSLNESLSSSNKENSKVKSLNDVRNEDDDIEQDDTNNNENELPITMKPFKTSIYPSTPLRLSKPSQFLTYRDQVVSSPMEASCLFGANDSFNSEKGLLDSPADNLKQINENNETNNNEQLHKIELKPSILGPPPRTPVKNSLTEFSVSTPNVNDFTEDNNLSSKIEQDYLDGPWLQERHIKITNTEKGLEMIGRHLAKEHNVDWREYWDFIDSFIDICSPEGLQKLENFLAQQKKEADMKKKTSETAFNAVVILDDVCNALKQFSVNKEENRLDDFPTPTSQQSTTPYTCVEKSLQVFAKRITKTIAHNIDNVTSINDTLLSELKRLKSLIYSFKEDNRFLNVDFSKVHSRIGNLVAYYLNHSTDVNFPAKLKIHEILESLASLPGERREHIECLCAKIMAFFEQPNDDLPESLKSEEMCSNTWKEEMSCDCLWESNLSRKTSRRQRIEVRHKQQQQEAQKQMMKQLNNGGIGHRTNSASNDSSDDEMYWSACESSDSDENGFYSPVGSPSMISLLLDEDKEEEPYKIYIYGDEPTKRDLDVLNAIFHKEIDETKYPHIHAWREALLQFPTEQMDYFPSPSIVKKSHPVLNKSATLPSTKKLISQRALLQSTRQSILSKHLTSTPVDRSSSKTKNHLENSPDLLQNQQKQSQQLTQSLPLGKRLFMSPVKKNSNPSSPVPAIVEPKRPSTPLNKLRGLFTNYRDRKDSFSSNSTTSDIAGCDQNESDC